MKTKQNKKETIINNTYPSLKTKSINLKSEQKRNRYFCLGGARNI